MRLSIFNENDNVLLVGEGNFSFASALVRHNLKIALTASCYESIVVSEVGKKNVEYLRNNDARILLGVDATKLMEHPILKLESFDKIIFNFPHTGGKMKITRNRELLKRFFIAAEKSLKVDGQVIVTLCNGQGGTLADNPRRCWHDSWQIVEMAAHGNFLLTDVEPFVTSLFQNYTNTGYRSLEKGFNTQGSLTHFFKKVIYLHSINIAPKNKIDATEIVKSTTWKNFISTITQEKIFNANILLIYPLLFTFDITFSVGPDFDTFEFYLTLYNFAGLIVDDVEFVMSYKFPNSTKVTRTYRISYKSYNIPLYRKRIVDIHQNVISKILETNLNVSVTK